MGSDDEQRLGWVLTFGEKDLDKLRPEERIALGHDLRQLLPIGWGVTHAQGVPVAEPMMRHIQAVVREKIRTLLSDDRDVDAMMVDRKAGWSLPSGHDRLVRISHAGSKRARFSLVSEGDEQTTIVRGIADLVLRAGSRLRLCRNSACGKPFLATKRQEYCTPECSQIVRNRRKQRNKREDALMPQVSMVPSAKRAINLR
jgi:hypothetical protein